VCQPQSPLYWLIYNGTLLLNYFPILYKRSKTSNVDIPLALRINSHFFFVKVATDLYSVACTSYKISKLHSALHVPSILRNTVKQTSRIFAPVSFHSLETSCTITNCVGASISRPISSEFWNSHNATCALRRKRLN